MLPSVIRSTTILSALFTGVLLCPPPVRAQLGPADHLAAATALDSLTLPVAAGLDDLEAGPRPNRSGITAPTAQLVMDGEPQERTGGSVGVGPNLALMGVGVAMAIIGSFVDGNGGTAITLGGGVIFLVGLFRFLR